MRVLFLSHRLPYAPNRGDRVRAYHELKEMATFADIDLISLVHDDEEASHAGDLAAWTKSVHVVRVPKFANAARSLVALPGSRPVTHTMLYAPALAGTIDRVVRENEPDLVFAFCTGVAAVVLEEPLRRFPLVLDTVDADSAKWAALARTTKPPRAWIYAREARVLAAFERRVTIQARTTLITTAPERDLLQAVSPTARIDVMQNGVDAARLRPSDPPKASSTVVFCGVMNYQPNEEGAIWLARSVWPTVKRQHPAARLELVGSFPTRAVRDLASDQLGIVVTGHVADVRPHLWNGAAGAAPLLTARGVQNKVLEAIAAGLPTVVTPVVEAGLPPEIAPACLRGETPEAFARALVTVLEESPAERRARAERADVAALSWERRLAGFKEILIDAAR